MLAALRKKPTAPANPVQGGAPNAGGSPLADDTGALTAAERGAIGSHVRPCWTTDPGMPGLDKMQALLTVTTDANGTVRLANVAAADQGRLGDPLFRAFAERARARGARSAMREPAAAAQAARAQSTRSLSASALRSSRSSRCAP